MAFLLYGRQNRTTRIVHERIFWIDRDVSFFIGGGGPVAILFMFVRWQKGVWVMRNLGKE